MRQSDDKTVTIDDARELVADQALWPLVRDFLWDFVPSIHPSWLDCLTVGKLDLQETFKLSNRQTVKPTNSPTLKRFILETLEIEPCFHTFPKDDWSRLLLLDGATLESIAKWLGALACADALRKVTDGASVRELKAGLPGVYPEVFGYTEYFARDLKDLKDFKDLKEETIAGRVVLCGVSMLQSLLAPLPPALTSRLKFKMPKALCDSTGSAALRDTDFARPVAKLLKLRFPEAYTLCC